VTEEEASSDSYAQNFLVIFTIQTVNKPCRQAQHTFTEILLYAGMDENPQKVI
jgi:hypothetical protein